MTTEKARPTRTVPLYFDIFVVLAAAMCGLIYGSYYKFPGNVLGPIGGAITGFGWCFIIKFWLIRKKAYPTVIAGLVMGILTGLIAMFIINIPIFWGVANEPAYRNMYTARIHKSRCHDAHLMASSFRCFWTENTSEDYVSESFWNGGVMGGYLGLICGAMYGIANKYSRRMTESKYWSKPQLDLLYCVASAVVLGFLLMTVRPYRIKPYFFITFPSMLLLFGSWVLLKRYACRVINLWPVLGVLPLYIIDNVCLVLICSFIFSRRIKDEIIFEALIIGGIWGLIWGSIFATNKKFFYQPKLQDAEAIDG